MKQNVCLGDGSYIHFGLIYYNEIHKNQQCWVEREKRERERVRERERETETERERERKREVEVERE